MSKESHSRTETSKRLRLGPELRTYFLSPTPAHDPNPLSGPQRFEVFFAPDAEIVRRNPPFGRHRRRLCEDEGRPADGTRREMGEMPVVGETVLAGLRCHLSPLEN